MSKVKEVVVLSVTDDRHGIDFVVSSSTQKNTVEMAMHSNTRSHPSMRIDIDRDFALRLVDLLEKFAYSREVTSDFPSDSNE